MKAKLLVGVWHMAYGRLHAFMAFNRYAPFQPFQSFQPFSPTPYSILLSPSSWSPCLPVSLSILCPCLPVSCLPFAPFWLHAPCSMLS